MNINWSSNCLLNAKLTPLIVRPSRTDPSAMVPYISEDVRISGNMSGSISNAFNNV